MAQGQAVATRNETEVTTPMEMLASAIERGMGPEVIGQLMTLEERWRSNQGRRSFDQAVAEAKAKLPVIIKNRVGHNDKKYADFAAIASVVDPVLSEHGLGYRFTTEQDDKTIRVTCVLFHRDGHSEQTTLAGPADATGNKNAIQAIGSTLTYLQRYSLTQMLGLAASEDDNGKAAGLGEMLTEEQIKQLQSLIMEVDADLPKLLAYLKVERLEDIYADKFDAVKRVIEQKRSKK